MSPNKEIVRQDESALEARPAAEPSEKPLAALRKIQQIERIRKKSGAAELIKRISIERDPLVDAILEYDDLENRLNFYGKKPADFSDPADRQACQNLQTIMDKILAKFDRIDEAKVLVEAALVPFADSQKNTFAGRRRLSQRLENIRQEYHLYYPLPNEKVSPLLPLAKEIASLKDYTVKHAELERLMNFELPELLNQQTALCSGIESAAVAVQCQGFFNDLAVLKERDGEFAKLGATSERFALLPQAAELIEKLKNIPALAFDERVNEVRLKASADNQAREMRGWLEDLVRIIERYKNLPIEENQRQSFFAALESLTKEVQKWSSLIQTNPVLIESKKIQQGIGNLRDQAQKIRESIIETYAVDIRPFLQMPRGPIAGEKPPEALAEIAEAARQKLEAALNQRFAEFGSAQRFALASPENLPSELTPEHLQALTEIFGPKNLQPLLLPTAPELQDLDEPYAQVMYPEKQQPADTAKKLTSFRPTWFNQPAEASYQTPEAQTWGQVYLRSMRAELTDLGGSLLLMETIQKPNYKNGSQRYGTSAGTEAGQDPLLPLFQSAFGPKANRFNHSWTELTETLLPLVKQKIIAIFNAKGLAPLDLEVILAPAPAFNLQTTLFHPENSQTNTWEWSSTIVLDKDDQDSERRLNVGHSESGGAANVDHGHRGNRWVNGGARLAVVLRRKPAES